jgi:REP element-mobilizing transposase RayT
MKHAGWRSRGYLPHCDGAHLIQHIVLRTAGADHGIESQFGQKLLARDEAASAVQQALLHFMGERYELWAWCVMPNHVHVIMRQLEGWPLQRVVHSWKSFTANQINKIHGRAGSVWQREYFDRFMRDNDELSTTIEYVEQNPVAAGLVERAEDWRWSSAHLRARSKVPAGSRRS